MKKKNNYQKNKPDLQLSITRATRTIYFFIVLFMLSIVLFDSGNLITRESVIDRWTIATILLVVNTAVWYVAAQDAPFTLKRLALPVLSVVLIIFAGFITYWERGMASTSTIFYALPILVIALTKNRHALQAIATLSAGTYAFAAVRYFNDFFNEGYRIQLWGTIVIISAAIFTVAFLTMNIAGLRRDSK